MAFFLLYDVISGYDVTIPAPDVAHIVVRTFFYLRIKFEAELYTWWVCRPFRSSIAFFGCSSHLLVYENDRTKKIVYYVKMKSGWTL